MGQASDNIDKDVPKRGRTLRRIALWIGGSLGLLVVLAAVGVAGLLWYARGQAFDAPAWLKDRAEARLAETLPSVDIRFGGITLEVAEDWQPSLHLRDLQITPAGQTSAITLSDVTGSFDLPALLEGNVRPRVIRVTGTRLRLSRDTAGAYGVSFSAASDVGGALASQGVGQEVGQLVDSFSSMLEHPSFAKLSRVEGAALTMRYEDRRSGRAWTLDGGRVELTRDGRDLRLRGDFAVLGGHAYATTGEVSINGTLFSRAISLAVQVEDASARDIATQSAGLAWLGVLDAPISGALRASTDEDGVLGPLSGTLQIGAGNLAPDETQDPVPFTAARTYFQYDPASQTLRFDELSVKSAFVDATAEGRISLDDVTDGVPGAMTGQLRFTELITNPAGIYPVPLYLEGAEAEMRLTLDPFHLEVGRLDIRDRGQVMAINGWIKVEPKGWDLSLTARAAEFSADDILELWPAGAVAKTREWVARNVLDGTVRNLQLGIRSYPTTRPHIVLGFDFEDLITTFMRTMPPIEGASGRAELRDDRFVITTDGGWLFTPGETQGLSIAGTSFIYKNVRVPKGPAAVMIRAKGDLAEVLNLIDQEPLQLLTKAGRSPDIATGQAEVAADLAFDLVKKVPVESIDVSYRATVTEMASDVLVPGQSLTADALTIEGTKGQITVAGAARLGAIPFEGSWQAQLGPDSGGRSQVEGWVTVTDAVADQLNMGLPPGSLGGQGQAKLRLDLEKGQPPAFALSSDLAGLSVNIPALNYRLSQQQTGNFEVSGTLGAPPRIDRISLDAPGLRAAGAITLRPDGQGLDTARFDRVRLAGWLDAPVTLTGRGRNVPPKVTLSGGALDLRQMDLGKSTGKGGPISLTLDRLTVSDGITLRNMRGDLNTAGGVSGQFTASLNGQTPITGNLAPQNGGTAVRITSNNAGRALAAAGMLKQGRGGTLDLTMTPVGPKGTYDGSLAIKDIWIQDAPAMASLLSALSIVGLLEQMSGNGILFNSAEADFRLSPSRVTLRSASAVGASMGVSMDGVYDTANKTMDMQGVISPLYVLNGIGRIFSRNDGEGLIGFNYRLLGSVTNPRVQVNPLSLFTPGMFREIFRRPPPKTN